MSQHITHNLNSGKDSQINQQAYTQSTSALNNSDKNNLNHSNVSDANRALTSNMAYKNQTKAQEECSHINLNILSRKSVMGDVTPPTMVRTEDESQISFNYGKERDPGRAPSTLYSRGLDKFLAGDHCRMTSKSQVKYIHNQGIYGSNVSSKAMSKQLIKSSYTRQCVPSGITNQEQLADLKQMQQVSSMSQRQPQVSQQAPQYYSTNVNQTQSNKQKPTSSFTGIARDQRTQMNVFLKHKDEGNYSSLNSRVLQPRPKSTCKTLDQERDDLTKIKEETKMQLAKPGFEQAKRNIKRGKYTNSQLMQQKCIDQTIVRKQQKTKECALNRKEYIHMKRHGNGVLGAWETPETSACSKVYKDLNQARINKDVRIHKNQHFRNQHITKTGGTSSQVEFCQNQSQATRQRDQVALIHTLWQHKRQVVPQNHTSKDTHNQVFNRDIVNSSMLKEEYATQQEYKSPVKQLRPQQRASMEKRCFNIVSGTKVNNFFVN